MFKVNNISTKPRCEICSKLTIKKKQNDATGVVLVTLLLTLNVSVSLVNFYQVNAGWAKVLTGF